jgi:hypothetical protein
MSTSQALSVRSSQAPTRPFPAMPDFDAVILPALKKIPFFREASDEEISRSYATYQRGDIFGLIDTWRAIASPTRGTVTGAYGFIYDHVGRLPPALNRLSVLATMRAILQAGVRFRETLRPATRAALQKEFPWLERRHLHIPPGWAPRLSFPAAFGAFLDSGSLDDARARWQLCAGLNEVQQAVYSADMARRFRMPELLKQSEREAELAVNYFGHWSPPATAALWRQCILVLDGLNAAVLAMTCSPRGPLIMLRTLLTALSGRGAAEWHHFLVGLDQPQPLLPPPQSQ